MIVQLVVTDRIRDAIAQVLVIKSIPEDLRNELQKWKRSRNGATKVEDVAVDDNSTISFRTVQKMVQLLKKGDKKVDYQATSQSLLYLLAADVSRPLPTVFPNFSLIVYIL